MFFFYLINIINIQCQYSSQAIQSHVKMKAVAEYIQDAAKLEAERVVREAERAKWTQSQSRRDAARIEHETFMSRLKARKP